MKQIDRHIAGHVLGFSAIVALALIALQSFISLVAEAEDLGDRYGFGDMLLVVLYQTPNIMLLLMPLVALLGTLLGLGALAQQSELVAMRAAGVSLTRIGFATLTGGVLMAGVALALTDVIAPAGERAAERIKSEARYGTDPGALTRPVWLRGEEQIYHIRRLLTPTHAESVTLYSLDEDKAIAVIAEVGEARFDDGRWEARDIVQTRFGEDGVVRERLVALDWDHGPTPDVLELIMLEADALSIRGLARLVRYLEANGLDAQVERVSLWRKIVAPFTVLVMMLLAVPFVLGSLRDTGTGQRLLIGILFGVGFWVMNEVVANSAIIYRWPPAPAALTPSLAVLALALWRLRAARN